MNIEEIEGIGPQFAEQLRGAGVRTTEALLERGGTRKGRQELADASGLTGARILEWVNRADLFRIKGIGSEFSDLLEVAGVDTVAELAQRNATNLAAALAKAVEERPSIVRRVPSESVVADWIAQAKDLPRAVEY
jgi:predicted flap endonuclease-1-like 5' DNA nuclease